MIHSRTSSMTTSPEFEIWIRMELPIKFPDDARVIAEEAARFRGLTPAQRIEVIRGLLAAGSLMMRRSPKSDFLRQYTLEQENRARQAVKEFIARHAK